MHDLVELFGGHFMSEVPDPYPVYARLRLDAPVTLVDLPMAPGYIVTRYDDVLSILKDAALFSSQANAKGIGLVMGKTIIEMDGKEHSRHRNLVSAAFVPKALQGDLPRVIDGIAHDMIDRFAGGGTAELVSQFTRTFPLRVIAHVIGVPIEDYETFKTWSLDLIGFADDPPKGFEAATKLVDYLRPIVESRKVERREDLLTTLTHADVDGHALDDEEIYGFLRLLLPAGSDTTYRLIGSTLFALLTHRSQLDAVCADRSRIDAAIEETLRWEAPVQFAARETTAPTELGGVELAVGSQLLTAIGSANRDERRYAHPERFDIERHADDHVAFGFGRHFCLGSHLARLEARTALNALLDRLPNLRLDPHHSGAIVGLAFRSPNRLAVRFDPQIGQHERDARMPDFQTLVYEEKDGVAWVTLNRPDVHNAFNVQMQRELYDLWRGLRRNDAVRVVVLTGAGDKAFCTGIDRTETMGQAAGPAERVVGAASTPFMFDDPGANIGPKSCDLWKPVIAAVNGMACGGAFYMLGEVEFIIAAEHATFFDPHVTYGMTAAFEPMHMLGKMPFHEIMRLSLLGNHERLSAKRAHEIGLVSEVVPKDGLRAAAQWAAEAIASAPPLAIQGTVRAIWAARELSRSQALSLGYAFIGLGTNQESIRQGQAAFAGGKRVQWKLR